MGVRGRSREDITINGGKRVIRLVSNCHFIFMLFVDGNMVSEVE